MNRVRLITVLLITFCIVLTIFQAAQGITIHPKQGDLLYYGDVADLRGVVGITNNISWWTSYDNTAVDPPDHIMTLGIDPFYPNNISAYKITAILEPGYWYQWDGQNERKPVVAFYLMAMTRPVTPTPVPTQTPRILAPVVVNPQPPPVADILAARGEPLTYDLNSPCHVWMLGPSLEVLGNQTNGTFALDSLDLMTGTYDLIAQYPDANGVYEVYADPTTMNIDSTWKGVDAFWYAPFTGSVLQDKLMAMFNDTAHFHGRVEQFKAIVQEQRADVNTMDEQPDGSLLLTGQTNLAKGDVVRLIFDETNNPLALDQRHLTFYGNVTGDDIGAYRLWQATLSVNLQTQQPGNHWISVYTPDGEKSTVPFHLSEVFKPFEPPAAHLVYINSSPWFPTPTPIIIERQVPVTVVQVVTVPVTPPPEMILQAQMVAYRQVADEHEAMWIGNILTGAFLLALAVAGYKSARYLQSVMKRAKTVKL